MTNYIVAVWTGGRRRHEQEYVDDRAVYIKKQIEQLNNLNHNIGQVTFVINDNPDESIEVKNYINSIPNKIKDTDIVILRRPNIGMSYGAWAYVYEKYTNQFDYYIIQEDDYIPVIDNFDKILIELLHEKQLDYLCELYKDNHASASGGIMFSRTLSDIYYKGGKLPFPNNSHYGNVEDYGQRKISKIFTDNGFKVGDYTDRYKFIFEKLTGGIITFGDESLDLIFAPSSYKIK